VPLPDTVAVPTSFQVEGHEVGAVVDGPNTLNVIVPVGEVPCDSAADTDDAAIGLPSVPNDGALSDNPGRTTVSAIPAPHVLCSGLLFVSPS
jgi:hypothetical protein